MKIADKLKKRSSEREASEKRAPERKTAKRSFGRKAVSDKTIAVSTQTRQAPRPVGTGFAAAVNGDMVDFSASIRAAKPILKLKGHEKAPGLKADLLQNIAGTALIAAVLGLFCMAQEMPDLIPYMMAGAALFFGITLVEALRPGKLRWLLLGVIAALLVASLILLRGQIGGGLASMMDNFYDYAEEAQAYVYRRFNVSESASEHFAAIWVSCLLGLLTALPPARTRRASITLLALAAMFAVAYYGMIPSWICIAVMLVALIFLISDGSILSTLPLLLAALIVFEGLMLIDPGESYGISRMDEKFRDRFAFHSSLIESPQDETKDTENIDSIEEDKNTENENDGAFDGEYGTYTAIGIAVAIALAIAAVVYLISRRLKKKQAIVRAGINSKDPKTAVTAIFPYSIRWLRACGIETGKNTEEPFSAMIPAVSREFTSDYGKRFGSMYELWKEAAYSDHAVSDQSLRDMKVFMEDTIKFSKNKCTFKDKLKIKLRYAL